MSTFFAKRLDRLAIRQYTVCRLAVRQHKIWWPPISFSIHFHSFLQHIPLNNFSVPVQKTSAHDSASMGSQQKKVVITRMYPNLLGQKALHKLSDADMANIISVSRNTFRQKCESGRFTPAECKTFCNHFGKSFSYLFATDGDDHAK